MVVDILMCTYNGQEFIAQQIQSILNQTHTDFRLIIVDDISKDRTVEIIQEMMLLDKRIEFHQNTTNLGYFSNFLSGLNYVTSEYLFFADQDDIWLENKIEIQLADLIQEDEKVLMNFSNSFLFYGESLNETKFSTKRDPKKIKQYYCSSIELSLRNIVAGHTILIRSNQIPYIKESMSKILDKKELYFDYILTLILLDRGEVKYFNESLVYFRQHPNSTSTKMRMNYYKYVSSNASAFSKISESHKMVKFFSVLHKTLSKQSNLLDYMRLLFQNFNNLDKVLGNYDLYSNNSRPSFFKRVFICFRLTYRFYVQK